MFNILELLVTGFKWGSKHINMVIGVIACLLVWHLITLNNSQKQRIEMLNVQMEHTNQLAKERLNQLNRMENLMQRQREEAQVYLKTVANEKVKSENEIKTIAQEIKKNECSNAALPSSIINSLHD